MCGHGSELASKPGEREDPAGSPERPNAAHHRRGEDKVGKSTLTTPIYEPVAG